MISNIIKFVWNNKIIEINNPDPNETLLNFIRLKLKKNWNKRRLCRRRLWSMHYSSR